MAETILKVFLKDLMTLRVICQTCSGVGEYDVKKMADTAFRTQSCPFCQKPIVAVGQSYPISELVQALLRLQAIEQSVKIEFPVKIEDGK